MSISGDIAINIIRFIHPGKGSYENIDKFKKMAVRENAKAKFVMPKDKKAKYELLEGTEYPCLIIRSRKNKTYDKTKAVMFIYGGVTNCWKIQIGFAIDYANRTGVDVWYPIYPSITEVNITKSIEVLYDVYVTMTGKYDSKKIALVGLSIGGSFAFEMIDRNNKSDTPVGMPGLIIAHSPVGMPDCSEDWEKLQAYEEKDPFFSIKDLKVIEEIIIHDETVKDYSLTPLDKCFKNSPPSYIYYGEELLAGNAASYKHAFERDGAGENIHIDIKKNMMHMYSCTPVLPESKQSYAEGIELIDKL